jgi:hypothetical protein
MDPVRNTLASDNISTPIDITVMSADASNDSSLNTWVRCRYFHV